ncbi:MAG: hypothetical protein GKR89_14210 [Candidatus Latescibacteria bacterium]|nr:hypothetical protein [Candidatus Latescibacterota bacterium]
MGTTFSFGQRSVGFFTGVTLLLAMSVPSPGRGQTQVWHIGQGGLSWTSQAQTQIGALDVDGALQPLELAAGENLIELLRSSGQRFLNGQPRDFVVGGQPRTWSNDAFFNQLNGPLDLLDGDEQTSSEGVFKTSQSQAGATFFWDLGAPFPVERIRFFPDPDDPDAFIKAFELRINDGETFNNINRPDYDLLRRVEANRQMVVDIEFAPLQSRFLQLVVLSKTVFNLAEFEIYGQGFVPVASYVSELHSFGGAVNYGLLRLHATRLTRGGQEPDEGPSAVLQLRTGADDTPLAYFRRDRETGSQEEVSAAEYNADLPRRALFRQDPITEEVLEEMAGRAEYLDLPVAEQGPVRDFVKGDVRDDVGNWSSWSPGILIDKTGGLEQPVELPSPREFMQFRVFFDGDANNVMRLDTLQVEFSPGLVSEAVGEIALAADPAPSGVLEVEGGIETLFVYDIRTEFAQDALAGYRGLRVEAFPAPVFERLEMGAPLVQVADVGVVETDRGFDLAFPPVGADNNQPLRVGFRLRLLEYNTPVNAWLLGDDRAPAHPIAPGDASDAINTGTLNVFTIGSQPEVKVDISTPVLTPNGDGANDAARISLILSQFADNTTVEVEIFDLGGRLVRQLVAQERSAGAYGEVWDGRDGQGQLVAPGIYLCRVGVEADAETFEDMQLIGVVY